MARTAPRQRKTIGRVMHEFKHGELESGAQGKGGKVKSRRQAVAIALSEAGASNKQSAAENKKSLARTKRKEARGQTAQQEHEGKSHVGASSDRASGRGRRGDSRRPGASRNRDGGATKADLYRRAQARGISGRSKMSKRDLEKALS